MSKGYWIVRVDMSRATKASSRAAGAAPSPTSKSPEHRDVP